MELKTKRRTFKEVSTAAYSKGHADGYADAVQLHAQVRDALQAENKRLQACLDKGIWSRLTDLFKGGRHAI
jgi:hypothetical protein